MAKKDDEKNKRLTAPTPTYTKVEASGNAGYKRPEAPKNERKSNIVVSQADLTPKERQPIQNRGALAALQPKPVTTTDDKGMTKGLPPMPPTGYLMNNPAINPQPVQPQSPEQWKDTNMQRIAGIAPKSPTPSTSYGNFVQNPSAQTAQEYFKSAEPAPEPKTFGDRYNEFSAGVHSGSTLGIGPWIDDKLADLLGQPRRERYDTGYSRAGELVGNVLPAGKAGEVATAVTAPIKNWLGRSATRGALGGALFGTAREISEAALGQNDQSLLERAKDVGIDTGLGLGADVGLSWMGKGLVSLVSKWRGQGVPEEQIQEMVETVSREQGAVTSKPEPLQNRGSLSRETEQAIPQKAPAQPLQNRGALSNADFAAAAESPVQPRQVPKQGERALYSNIESTNVPDAELRTKLAETDRSYTPITNEATVAAANKRISKDLEKAISYARSGGKTDAEKVATGFRALQELQNAGRYEEAVDLVDNLAEKLTRAGQTIQAASLLDRLSPEGQLLRAQRLINEVNKTRPAGKQITLTPETTKKITDAAQAAQTARLSQERAAEVLQISEKLRAGQELTELEMQTLSDFADDLKAFMDDSKPDLSPPRPTEELRNPRKRDKVVSWLEEKAAAAQDRLNRRRNNLSANPLDTWADMAIVTAAKLARRGLKFSDYTAEMIAEFGDEVRPFLQKAYDQGKKALARESKRALSSQAKSAQKSIQKQINQTEAGKVAEKYIRDNAQRMKPDDIEKIRDLAQKLSQMSGKTRTENEMALQKILNEFESSSWWDRVQTIRYIAMLFNTSTQTVNALSGPMMATMGTIADILPAMVDRALNVTLKKPRHITTYGTNPFRFLGQYFKNLATGAKAGWHGLNPDGIAGMNDIRGLTYKGKNPISFVPSILERSLGAVAKGADYATYKTVMQSELKRSGYLDAVNKGIKGRQARTRHVENFVANPTSEAMEQADKIARNTTFQRQDTLGGKTANWLTGAAPAPVKPIVGAVFPFVRTPINIASTAVTMTPAGILKGLFQLTRKSQATQREALRTLGLGLTGTGMSVLGYELSKAGIITGANDSGDKDLDAIREQAGQGKYRFNTDAAQRFLMALINGDGYDAAVSAAKYQEGDHQFDYNKLQPLALPVSIGAGYEEQKGDTTDKLANAGEAAYGSLFSMSTLKGAQDILKPDMTGSQGQKQLGVLSRFAESFAKSFSPSLLAQAARVMDPTQRKTSYNEGFVTDVGDYFKSRTPFLSDSLQPRKTTLGQDMMNAPGISGQFANPYKSDVAPYTKAAAFISDLIDRTGDVGLAPSAPDKKVRGKDKTTGNEVVIAIPPDRYTKYQQDIGDEIIAQINSIPANLSDQKKAERVLKIYEEVETKYRNRIKRELGIRVSK